MTRERKLPFVDFPFSFMFFLLHLRFQVEKCWRKVVGVEFSSNIRWLDENLQVGRRDDAHLRCRGFGGSFFISSHNIMTYAAASFSIAEILISASPPPPRSVGAKIANRLEGVCFRLADYSAVGRSISSKPKF